MKVTLITPVFNRKYKLLELYESLKKQTCMNFEWVIVNDGSIDDVADLVSEFISKKNGFKIIFIDNKKNEGKHIALNSGIAAATGDVTAIIDSDDLALPCMIEKIIKAWSSKNRIEDNSLGLIVFQREGKDGIPVRSFLQDEHRENLVSYRYGHGLIGDYAETFKTKVLKEYRFPKFENENFLSEEYLWIDIGFQYEAVFLQSSLWITEYNNDGLTINSKKLMWKNPIGVANTAQKKLAIKMPIKLTIKNAIVFIVFATRCKNKGVNIDRSLPYSMPSTFFLHSFAMIIYFVFRIKFGKA